MDECLFCFIFQRVNDDHIRLVVDSICWLSTWKELEMKEFWKILINGVVIGMSISLLIMEIGLFTSSIWNPILIIIVLMSFGLCLSWFVKRSQ